MIFCNESHSKWQNHSTIDLLTVDTVITCSNITGCKQESRENFVDTVKPEIFVCPLFCEFRDLSKFTKITGREYSNGNLVYCITSSSASKKWQN